MQTRKTLIIGYGNTLRSDDGVGVRVAEALAEENLAGVETLTLHQLTPELAEEIAKVEAVIFVDASLDAKEVMVQSLVPSWDDSWTGHHSSPPSLLGLTQALYGRVPPAWWLLIPAHNVEMGENLSPDSQEQLLKALELIKELMEWD